MCVKIISRIPVLYSSLKATVDKTQQFPPGVFTIRSITPEDAPALVALAGSSGLFRPEELVGFQEMLEDYHARKASSGHEILTYENQGSLLGIAWYCPRVFTDRVWELLMIAVDADHQRRGIGSLLLRAVENARRTANSRLLLIETSDLCEFERTRRFYRKHGYSEVARIPDYFSDGDGKASFTKRM